MSIDPPKAIRELIREAVLGACQEFFTEYKIKEVTYVPSLNIFHENADISRWIIIKIPFESEKNSGLLEVVCEPTFGMHTWPIEYNTNFEADFLQDWLKEVGNQMLSKIVLSLYDYGVKIDVKCPAVSEYATFGIPIKSAEIRVQMPLTYLESQMHVFFQCRHEASQTFLDRVSHEEDMANDDDDFIF